MATVSVVCPLGSVKEVRFSSERNSSLRKCWVGPNSNPAFRALDDDLFPNIAVEHAGALVHTARDLVDLEQDHHRTEHRISV